MGERKRREVAIFGTQIGGPKKRTDVDCPLLRGLNKRLFKMGLWFCLSGVWMVVDGSPTSAQKDDRQSLTFLSNISWSQRSPPHFAGPGGDWSGLFCYVVIGLLCCFEISGTCRRWSCTGSRRPQRWRRGFHTSRLPWCTSSCRNGICRGTASTWPPWCRGSASAPSWRRRWPSSCSLEIDEHLTSFPGWL